MIIVVTGMVGLSKKQYLQDVCKLAEIKQRQVRLFNVGDLMYEEATDIAPGRILDIPLKRLHLLRRSVFKDIIAKSKRLQNVIVNTHATFRWRHGLFPAFDFDQIKKLGADMYICLIDGIESLHTRLMNEHSVRHTLKDLMVWREEEILATEMMRNGTNKKALFYCLARGNSQQTVEAFYRLLFEQDRKKAYLSFPMTHVADKDDIIAKIQDFRRQMKEFLTCFDPGDLEEAYLPYYAGKAARQGLDHVTLDCLGKSVSFDVAEVKQIQADIDSQIYARDFALIDQADMIISFIPELQDGRAAVSSGVERELQHAYEAAKEVYIIWPGRQRPSVFVTQTATRVFKSVSEAVEFFNC